MNEESPETDAPRLSQNSPDQQRPIGLILLGTVGGGTIGGLMSNQDSQFVESAGPLLTILMTLGGALAFAWPRRGQSLIRLVTSATVGAIVCGVSMGLGWWWWKSIAEAPGASVGFHADRLLFGIMIGALVGAVATTKGWRFT